MTPPAFSVVQGCQMCGPQARSRPRMGFFPAHKMISRRYSFVYTIYTNELQIWPPLDATIVFLLHKQTVNTGAEQAGPSTATPKLYCLSS